VNAIVTTRKIFVKKFPKAFSPMSKRIQERFMNTCKNIGTQRFSFHSINNQANHAPPKKVTRKTPVVSAKEEP
jgi:hypothetical protein